MISSPLANVKLELVDSIDQAMALKRWLGDRRRDVLGVDTESSGLKPERDVLRMVQVGDLETGWAIPWDLWGGVAMEILNSYTGPMVLHNASFDMRFLQTHAAYMPPWERIHDTMTMAHLIDPARPKGLKPLADRLVDPRATAGQALLNKAMSDNDWTWATVPTDNPYYWVYAALDPVLTCHVREKLWPTIMNVGSERAYDLEMGAVRVCANMMLRGVRIDKAYCVRKAASLRDWSAQARKWLKDSYGITNATSNAQILKCLQDQGIEFTKLTPKGAYAIDKEVLDAIEHPVAEYVVAIRRAEKICSSYLDNLISLADHNDVVHCNINPLGARTGRMSITDPALQTLHRTDPTVRNAFIPSEGNQIIACDADQIEARLASHFSGDIGMQEAFLSPDDFFCIVASEIFGEPVIKGDPRRQTTKNVVYGSIYGAGVRTMARTAKVTYEQMEPVKRAFDLRFPGLNQLMQRVTSVAHQRLIDEGAAYVTTPLGRRVPSMDQREYALVNYLIQSHAAEVLKKGLVDLDAAGLGPNMVFPVHDEIVADVPAIDVIEVKHLIESTLNDPDTYAVPLTWSADIFEERWAPK